MNIDEKKEYLKMVYDEALRVGLCKNKTEWAALLEVDRTGLSSAMNGNPKACTDSLVSKVRMWAKVNGLEPAEQGTKSPADTVLVLPWEAKGGLIGDFVDGIQQYQCERIVSPIRGADYAMQVVGDSMSPDYPSGSIILIKRIDEAIFVEWGKVYVLDTPNGAVIKRVRKTDDPNLVECISINPNYQPFTVDCRHINGWYRVLMVMAAK